MKKVIIAAFVITLALSAAIISLRPTGMLVSSGSGEKERMTVDVGSAEIEAGKLEFMDINFDFAMKSI